MTDELTKNFFDTFGIEQIDYKGCSWGGYCPYEEHIDCGECSYWETWKTDYPEITSDILLELICVITEWDNVELFAIKDVENLKENILNQAVNIITNKEVYCDDFDEQIIHQVRTLFEES